MTRTYDPKKIALLSTEEWKLFQSDVRQEILDFREEFSNEIIKCDERMRSHNLYRPFSDVMNRILDIEEEEVELLAEKQEMEDIGVDHRVKAIEDNLRELHRESLELDDEYSAMDARLRVDIQCPVTPRAMIVYTRELNRVRDLGLLGIKQAVVNDVFRDRMYKDEVMLEHQVKQKYGI
jgi:hypothetical protein